MRRSLFFVALALFGAGAFAQLATPDVDWREAEAPTPPALNTDKLIELEMPRSSLRFGVDPASVSIGPDGIVRYVVVARSSTGTVNAFYEGIRCNTAEVKTYARHTPGSGWVKAQNADWKPLHEVSNSRHSLLIARSGACSGHSPNRTAATIVRDLRSPVDTRYENETR
jgi:hypothetical protein